MWQGSYESDALIYGAYKLRMTAEIVGPSDPAGLYDSAYNPDPGETFQSLLEMEVTICKILFFIALCT